MKKRKKYLLVIVFCLLITYLCSFLSFGSFDITKTEQVAVETVLKEEMPALEESLSIENWNLSQYQMNDLQKIYWLDAMPITTYRETKSVNCIITEKYQYRVPVGQHEDKMVVAILTVNEKDNKVELAGINESFLVSDKQIEQSLSQAGMKLKKTEDIRITAASLYHGFFVFFHYDEADYVIPFTNGDKEMNLTDGKVYSVDEMFEVLYQTYDEEKLLKEPNSNGGVPLRQLSVNTITIIIVALIFCAGAICVPIVVFVKHKTKFGSKLLKNAQNNK